MAERCDSCSARRKETMEKTKQQQKNRKLLAGKKVKAADELLLLYINADYICRGGMQGEGGAP